MGDQVATATNDSSGVAQVFTGLLGTLQYGLSRAIDAEYPRPWSINDPAAYQYAVGPTGQYYYRGVPGTLPGAVQPLDPLTVMLGVAAVAALAYVLLK